MITAPSQPPVIETDEGTSRAGATAALVDRLVRLFAWADANEISLHAAFDRAEKVFLEQVDPGPPPRRPR